MPSGQLDVHITEDNLVRNERAFRDTYERKNVVRAIDIYQNNHPQIGPIKLPKIIPKIRPVVGKQYVDSISQKQIKRIVMYKSLLITAHMEGFKAISFDVRNKNDVISFLNSVEDTI